MNAATSMTAAAKKNSEVYVPVASMSMPAKMGPSVRPMVPTVDVTPDPVPVISGGK